MNIVQVLYVLSESVVDASVQWSDPLIFLSVLTESPATLHYRILHR